MRRNFLDSMGALLHMYCVFFDQLIFDLSEIFRDGSVINIGTGLRVLGYYHVALELG